MTETTKAILARRSIKRASSAPIERAKIDLLLEQAAYAPFHSKQEPWNAYIIGSKSGKEKLLQAIGKSIEATRGDTIAAEKKQELLEKNKQKLEKPPYLIIITAKQVEEEKKDFEAIAAVSAFIQNFQLLAWEAGVGMIWRTNKFIFDKAFARALAIPDENKVIGILYLSVLEDNVPEVKKRSPIEEWVTEIE